MPTKSSMLERVTPFFDLVRDAEDVDEDGRAGGEVDADVGRAGHDLGPVAQAPVEDLGEELAGRLARRALGCPYALDL